MHVYFEYSMIWFDQQCGYNMWSRPPHLPQLRDSSCDIGLPTSQVFGEQNGDVVERLLLLFNFVRLTATLTRNGFQFVVYRLLRHMTIIRDRNSWERKGAKQKEEEEEKRVSFNDWLSLGPTTFFRVHKMKCLVRFSSTQLLEFITYTGLHT